MSMGDFRRSRRKVQGFAAGGNAFGTYGEGTGAPSATPGTPGSTPQVGSTQGQYTGDAGYTAGTNGAAGTFDNQGDALQAYAMNNTPGRPAGTGQYTGDAGYTAGKNGQEGTFNSVNNATFAYMLNQGGRGKETPGEVSELNNWMLPDTGAYGLAEGGVVGMDDGGDVPDPGGVIPSDPQNPGDNSTLGNGQPDSGDLMNKVMDALSTARKRAGLSDQMFAAMPSRPAGPGGDQPNTNPFPTKTGKSPFGKQAAADQRPLPGTGQPPQGVLEPTPKPFNPRDYLPKKAENDQGDQDQVQSAADGGDILPDDQDSGLAALPGQGTTPAPAADTTTPTGIGEPGAELGVGDPNNPIPSDNAVSGLGRAFSNAASTIGQTPGGEEPGGYGPAGGTNQQIMRYLHGVDALPQDQLQKVEQLVQSKYPNIKPTERNMRVVGMLQDVDPNLGAGALQAYRQQYDTYVAGTRKALAVGNDKTAAQNATLALTNVLDGNNIAVMPRGNGTFMVDVQSLGRNGQQFVLTKEQLNQLMKQPGGPGSGYDNWMEQDGGKILAQIAKSGGVPIEPIQTQQHFPGQPARNGAPPAPQKPAAWGGPSAQEVGGETITLPSGNKYQPGPNGTMKAQTFASAGTNKPQFAGPRPGADVEAGFQNFDPKMVTQAETMFPNSRQQQMQWLTQQASVKQEQESKLEIAKNTRLYGNQAIAQGREAGYEKRSQTALDVAKIQAAAKVAAKSDPRAAGVLQLIGHMAVNDPDKAIKYMADHGIDPQKYLQNPTQQPAEGEERSTGFQPPPGARFWNGKYYVRGPNGQSVLAPGQ